MEKTWRRDSAPKKPTQRHNGPRNLCHPGVSRARHCLVMKPNQAPIAAPLVLVVEDEPGIATILRAYLERDGLRAQLAEDGAEALQTFRSLRPDLVLLDIHLPTMDGIDVLRSIRDQGQTPVIMVTALADDVDKLVALRLGADDYVVKPFNPAEVVARVRAVLRRSQAKAEPRAAPIRVGALEINAEEHSALVYDEAGRSNLVADADRVSAARAARGPAQALFFAGAPDRALPARERCARARDRLPSLQIAAQAAAGRPGAID